MIYHLFLFCFIYIFNKIDAANVHYPAIFIPGDGGSQIWARLNRTLPPPHFFCSRHSDWFELWLDLRLIVPEVIDCFVDNMRLTYNETTKKTSNLEGVEIKIPGFGNTSTVEYFDASGFPYSSYFAPIVRSLVTLGYTRGVNLRGAPYDFRRGLDEQNEFFDDFTQLVKDTYELNNQTKIVLVTHSMGGPFVLYWLHRQTSDFKAKYIRSMINIAAPWGGAIKALRLMISGDNIDVYVVSPIRVRPYQRSAPSTAFVMPSINFWNKDEVVVVSPQRNYTVNDYEALFNDIQFPTGYAYWINNKDLVNELKPPEIESHELYGSHMPTPGVLLYNNRTFPDLQPIVLPDDGDGTVNIRSLRGFKNWESKQKQDIYSLEIPGVEHLAILKHPTTINYVTQVLTAQFDKK
ncbi:unnamed protein product [Rotaria sp. Silwood2]|nr:unnamed protein product [Rotaria sp. Silwood2]CAF2861216.1 unnamed protein product [Rotaria sp. Silwood2]CAF3239348.1 unnamed protein product [Rotaria sp. Silwood2]CAF4058863.1 unnamed protein product [Rotaria sp. Silwood2]CAF4137416.1 unnamed protein product [Rotaria sp. Silwood2]